MLSQVIGIVLLDSEGARLAVKYVPLPDENSIASSFASQTKFEAQLMLKINKLSNRNDVELLLAEDYIVLYKSVNDVNIFVIGDPEENELILAELISGIYNAISCCTGGQVSKRQIQENLGTVFLILDEVIDQRVIFETDPDVIAARVQMTEKLQGSEPSEQTAFNQALHNAKENLFRSFLSST